MAQKKFYDSPLLEIVNLTENVLLASGNDPLNADNDGEWLWGGNV